MPEVAIRLQGGRMARFDAKGPNKTVRSPVERQIDEALAAARGALYAGRYGEVVANCRSALEDAELLTSRIKSGQYKV